MTPGEQLNAITYNIMFANDLACGAVVQAVADARKSSFYRQAFKRDINLIEKARRDYERRLRFIIEDKMEYYMEACDQFTEPMEHDMNIFYWTIKQALDRDGFTDSALIARLQWARAMVQLASVVWENRTEEIAALHLIPRHENYNVIQVRGAIYYLSLEGMKKKFNAFLESYFPKSDYINCPEGQEAFNIIDRKMHDYQSVIEAAAHNQI